MTGVEDPKQQICYQTLAARDKRIGFLRSGYADTADVEIRDKPATVSDEPWQFHFDPTTYLDAVRAELPDYEELQERTARATEGIDARTILDLGVGTGETIARVAKVHPSAHVVGIDESPAMLDVARQRLPDADFLVSRLEDPLPPGSYDVIVSALAVHHLDAAGKADLFVRIAERLSPEGRFVMADVVIPENPADAVTPIDDIYDKPSRVSEQLLWLEDAGLSASIVWSRRDLAVVVAGRQQIETIS